MKHKCWPHRFPGVHAKMTDLGEGMKCRKHTQMLQHTALHMVNIDLWICCTSRAGMDVAMWQCLTLVAPCSFRSPEYTFFEITKHCRKHNFWFISSFGNWKEVFENWPLNAFCISQFFMECCLATNLRSWLWAGILGFYGLKGREHNLFVWRKVKIHSHQYFVGCLCSFKC